MVSCWVGDHIKSSKACSWLGDHIKSSKAMSWLEDHIKSSNACSWLGDQLRRARPVAGWETTILVVSHAFPQACETFDLGRQTMKGQIIKHAQMTKLA